MKGLGNLQNIMAQFQRELASQEFIGESGGGKVKVKVNGLQEVKEIRIDPEVVDPEDVETLEDLILVAIRQAMERSREHQEKYMRNLAASFGLTNIPGLF